jgi:hypothetical protein
MNGERKIWRGRDDWHRRLEFHNLGTAGLWAELHRFLHSRRTKMKTTSQLAILVGSTLAIVACVGCASPEKRAQEDADYRARFDRFSSIRMTEGGAGHVNETRQQFLPGAKVQLYVSYFTRGEHVEFKIEDENGTTVPVSGHLVMTSPPGTRKTHPPPGPGQPQLAYPFDVRHGQSGDLSTLELPVQYIDRNWPGQPWIPSPGGFAHCVASFRCPTALGRYLVVLDCPDLPNMERLKTYQFSVVETLPPKEDLN